MSDIPTELFRDILIYVPATPLFRFRSVCKAWRDIIDDPVFAKSHHLHLHRHHCQLDGGEKLIIRNHTGRLYSLPLNSLDNPFEICTKTIKSINIKTMKRRGLPCIPQLPVPSCDSLILIYHYEKTRIWALWNPFTGEFHELPSHNYPMSKFMFCVGLGYDIITNDYKVVIVMESYGFHGHTYLETLVYSLKLGIWKKITDFRNCRAPYLSHGVRFNGALLWITCLEKDLTILAFDLETESYGLMPFPSSLFGLNHDFLEKRLFSDVMGQSLFMSVSDINARFQIWMMEDYGGWTKLFSSKSMVDPRAVVYLKSKEEILIHYNRDKFVWFNVKEKKIVKKVTIEGMESNFTCQVFQPSLFRLRDSVVALIKVLA